MPKPFSILLKQKKIPTMLIASGIVAVIGASLLRASYASTPTISLEAESGILSGTMTKQFSSNASGGSYVVFGGGSTIVPAPDLPATVLSMVATDGVVSHAVCINDSFTSAGKKLTTCMQINPSNTSQARTGTYDIVNKNFTASSGWYGLPDVSAASRPTKKTCSSNGHGFLGFGPLSTPSGSIYFGQEFSGSTVMVGSINASNSCTTSGGGAVNTAAWASSAIYCSASAYSVSNVTALEGAIAAKKPEICVAPGYYELTTSLKPKANMKIIGDPIARADIDADKLDPIRTPSSPTYILTSSFHSVPDATGVTIANVIVRKSRTTAEGRVTCNTCGFGININSADGERVYNVKMTNNGQNGFHYHNTSKTPGNGYTVENSEISYNGNIEDLGNSSGGLKTTSAGKVIHNVVIYNTGPGLWCDVGCYGGTWVAQDNYAANNSRAGIRYETSYVSANITNNVLVNNVTDFIGNLGAKAGGISAQHTWNVTIRNNIIFNTNGTYGITVNDDFQTRPDPVAPKASQNVTATNNTMNGSRIYCISGSLPGRNETYLSILCSSNN